MAEFDFEYLSFKSLSALMMELISELVNSDRFFFDIGLPLRYKIASTLVTSSTSGNFLGIISA